MASKEAVDPNLLPTDSDDRGALPPDVLNGRGLPVSAVLRGVLGRFLPGSVISMAGLMGLVSLFGGPSLFEFLMVVALPSVGLAMGYGIGLEGLRRWLFPDAEVDGRRSLVAGFVSPLALFTWVTVVAESLGGLTLPVGVGVVLLLGMLMAVVMFFPWLTSDETDESHPGVDPSRRLIEAGGNRKPL